MADFASPGRKYTGKIQVGSGPFPLQRWSRAYTREQRDRKLGAEGVDLRPERKPTAGNSKLPNPKKDLDKGAKHAS